MTIWQKIKASLIRFMQGRHGPDNLSMFTLFAGLACSVLGSFTRLGLLSILGFVLYILTLFRMLSRNVYKRQEENSRYLRAKYRLQSRIRLIGERWKQRREYKFFVCPSCRATLRVPRGRGKIKIVCRKCGASFTGKS